MRDAGAVLHSHSPAALMATILDPTATEFRITQVEMIKVPASDRPRRLFAVLIAQFGNTTARIVVYYYYYYYDDDDYYYYYYYYYGRIF
jgi:hypothetical protein